MKHIIKTVVPKVTNDFVNTKSYRSAVLNLWLTEDHPKTQVFTISFIITAQVQLGSSNESNFIIGDQRNMKNSIKVLQH